MRSQFDSLIDRVLSHEGGFTLDPRDPGNWTGGKRNVGILKGTKFGVAANSYPNLDIKNLTRAQAIEIYRRDYWQKVQGDKLPAAFAYQALDAAVNHGWSRSIKWLQEAAGVKADGVIGPVTLAAVNKTHPSDLVLLFNAIRLEFYTNLPTWATYGKGWTRRVAQNLRDAAKDN